MEAHVTDRDVIEANYRRYLLRQLHGQLKEHQRRKSMALLTFAKDVTFTLRLLDGATFKLRGAISKVEKAFHGMGSGRSERVAHHRRKGQR